MRCAFQACRSLLRFPPCPVIGPDVSSPGSRAPYKLDRGQPLAEEQFHQAITRRTDSAGARSLKLRFRGSSGKEISLLDVESEIQSLELDGFLVGELTVATAVSILSKHGSLASAEMLMQKFEKR
eukprot:Sspe_Gene.99100::Locus_72493_Transcript_2_2_Confidence_0.429_Length_432::g.99100::m.99100